MQVAQDNAMGSANNTAGANSTAARCNRPSRCLLDIERVACSNSFFRSLLRTFFFLLVNFHQNMCGRTTPSRLSLSCPGHHTSREAREVERCRGTCESLDGGGGCANAPEAAHMEHALAFVRPAAACRPNEGAEAHHCRQVANAWCAPALCYRRERSPH